MKSIFRLLMLVVMLGGWALAGAAVYVVRTPEKILLVPKNRLSFEDTYVDTRQWTIADVANHPAVVTRMVELGKEDLLIHLVDADSRDDTRTQLIEAITHPPEPTPIKPRPATKSATTSTSLTEEVVKRVPNIFDFGGPEKSAAAK